LEVLDGRLSLTACVEGDHDSCERESQCLMSGRWNRVNAAIVGALKNLTLADMMSPFDYFIDAAAPTADKPAAVAPQAASPSRGESNARRF
jgi:DNA-binding IscR family transcriptional regulator